MITIIILAIISLIVLGILVFIFSIGGTIFTIIGADIIVALFILWFLFFRKKNKK